MSSCCQNHPYIVEIEEFNEKNFKAREYIAALKEAGKRGNALALFHLGHWYLNGVWDVKAMEDDLLLGRLKPATKEVTEDPYFLLPKDSSKGLQLLKTFIHMVETAKKSAQLNRFKLISQALLKKFDPAINSKAHLINAEPMVRPEVTKNSIESLFTTVAELNMAFYIFALIINLFLCSLYTMNVYFEWMNIEYSNVWLVFVIPMVFVYIPALLMIWFIKSKGVNSSQPLCSCGATTQCFNRIMNRVPEQDRVRLQNPYENIPWFTRNSLNIFAGYFVLIALASLVALFHLYNIKGLTTVDLPIIGHCDIGSLMMAIVSGGFAGILMCFFNFKGLFNHYGCYFFSLSSGCPIAPVKV